jgi:uncharacterized membrane protein YcaP (DUF421 family)
MDGAIQALDWHRMFFGDEPPAFFIEIIIRTSIIYLYVLLLLRWLGSRTIGQLSTIEFLLVIALGSAVGDAMFYPDVPLLHALLVITLVVLANKGLDVLIVKSRTAEIVVDGTPEEAIRDGVVCKAFIDSTSFSDSELFQQLREHGVENLGEVSHAYLETDGVLSVFKADASNPGLPIVPPWEISPPVEVSPIGRSDRATPVACKRCGTIADADTDTDICPNCSGKVWVLTARYAGAATK